MSKIKWRTEPVFVEKDSDDLWIAEKFQSNSVLLEIALGLALFSSMWR